MPDPLPSDLQEALRRPVPCDAVDRTRRVDAIMAGVRALPAPGRGSAPVRSLPPTLARRRGVLGPAGGVVVACALTLWLGVTSLTDLFGRSAAPAAAVEVIGDTVIRRLVPGAGHPGTSAAGVARQALRDTLYDTMRIVRLALRAPAASQVTLVQSASGAEARVRRLAAARDLAAGVWEVRTVVPRDAVTRTFAFVVDGTHRVPVRIPPSAAPVLPSSSTSGFPSSEPASVDTTL